MQIGCIGQGWVGKSYADEFEERGYTVIRYGLEPEYRNNRNRIQQCEIVFIAVPTPTTPDGFDASIVESVLHLVGKGNTAIIRSTLIPGTTDRLQHEFPHIRIFHAPEFLSEATAMTDVRNPSRNIIGIPKRDDESLALAKTILKILPHAGHEQIIDARSAELIKYVANAFLVQKIAYFNAIYELTEALGITYDTIREGVVSDPRIGTSHTQIYSASTHNPENIGRGAGGHCFIKDYRAFSDFYRNTIGDTTGYRMLQSVESYNIELLQNTGKDPEIVKDVFGYISET